MPQKSKLLDDLIEDIPLFMTEDLKQANKLIVAEIKRRMFAEAQRATFKFKVGDQVQFTGKNSSHLPHGAVGKILSIGVKNVTVKFDEYGGWKVVANMVEKI